MYYLALIYIAVTKSRDGTIHIPSKVKFSNPPVIIQSISQPSIETISLLLIRLISPYIYSSLCKLYPHFFASKENEENLSNIIHHIFKYMVIHKLYESVQH